MTTLHDLQPESSVDRFCSLLDRYEHFIKLAGKSVRRATPDKTRALFQSFVATEKVNVLKRLETEISIFEETVGASEALANPSRQLWRYLAKAKLIPCSDIFDKISDRDTIQVFNCHHRIDFVSLNFFDHVSFTLEQTFGEPWHTAVRRDAKVEQLLYEQFVRVFSGEIRKTTTVDNPWHCIEEVDTELNIKSQLHVKHLSPVYSQERLECVIAVVELLKHQEAG